MKTNRLISCLLVTCLLLPFLGCNRRPDLQMVEGVVTLDGEPCAYCTIAFMPKDGGGGQPGFATTDTNGEYRLSSLGGIPQKGTTVGDYGIYLDKKTTDPAVHRRASEYNPIQLLPQKYTDSSTSGFEITVEKGKNVHNFDMLSK